MMHTYIKSIRNILLLAVICYGLYWITEEEPSIPTPQSERTVRMIFFMDYDLFHEETPSQMTTFSSLQKESQLTQLEKGIEAFLKSPNKWTSQHDISTQFELLVFPITDDVLEQKCTIEFSLTADEFAKISTSRRIQREKFQVLHRAFRMVRVQDENVKNKGYKLFQTSLTLPKYLGGAQDINLIGYVSNLIQKDERREEAFAWFDFAKNSPSKNGHWILNDKEIIKAYKQLDDEESSLFKNYIHKVRHLLAKTPRNNVRIMLIEGNGRVEPDFGPPPNLSGPPKTLNDLQEFWKMFLIACGTVEEGHIQEHNHLNSFFDALRQIAK